MTLAAFVFLTALLLAVPLMAQRALGTALDRRRYARWAIFAGPSMLYALFLADRALGIAWAVSIGVASSIALAVVTARRSRHFRLVDYLGKKLSHEDSAAALAALDAQVVSWSGSGKFPSKEAAHLTLQAARYAIEAQHLPHALRWLAAIPECELTQDLRVPFAQYLASARLGTGDRKGAREALSAVSRPARPIEFEALLLAMDGLLDVLDEDPSAAARATNALAQKVPTAARVTWLAVHAHALAAAGDRDGARVALGEIREAVGEPGLRRVARHEGPASTLAAAMLVAEEPYR